MSSGGEYLLSNDVNTVPATIGTHTLLTVRYLNRNLKKYLILIRGEYQSLIKKSSECKRKT